jgi:mycothione reductase
LAGEDEEIAQRFTEVFARKYNVYAGHVPTSVTKKNGSFVVSAKSRKGEEIEVKSDQLMIATGRVPNSDTLGLEKTGVKTDRRGFIEVDEYLETSAKGIFALGDAVGRYMFKHSANHEAQYAYNNIASEKKLQLTMRLCPTQSLLCRRWQAWDIPSRN